MKRSAMRSCSRSHTWMDVTEYDPPTPGSSIQTSRCFRECIHCGKQAKPRRNQRPQRIEA